MKNILVALSRPQDAEHLIAQAVKFVKYTQAKIWIIHVTESEPEDFLAREAGPQYVYDKRAENQKKEAAFVNQCAKKITENHDLPAEGFLVKGAITKSIKNTVDEYNIELVIAGHRRKDFLYQLFTANNKKDLVDELKIPLLAIPLV